MRRFTRFRSLAYTCKYTDLPVTYLILTYLESSSSRIRLASMSEQVAGGVYEQKQTKRSFLIFFNKRSTVLGPPVATALYAGLN